MGINYKGINKKLTNILFNKYNLNKRIPRDILDVENMKNINELITDKMLINDLYIENSEKDLTFLVNLGSYRSVRHKLKLPCRGQRTKTNSRTVRRVYTPINSLLLKRNYSSVSVSSFFDVSSKIKDQDINSSQIKRIKQEYLKFIQKGYLTLKICVFKNNLFCTLRSSKSSSFYKLFWSGQQKIKISSKLLRLECSNLVKNFLKQIFSNKALLKNPLRIVLIAPKNIRRKLLLKLTTFFLKKEKYSYLLELPYKKPFNGCRARKIIRKKRKKLNVSLFKYN